MKTARSADVSPIGGRAARGANAPGAAEDGESRSAVGAPGRSSWLVVLASYVAAFAILAAPLLPSFPRALPPSLNLTDAHLFAWVLAWVAHALATDPTRVFDGNIGYPAPLQLTGTEHFFASQLLFSPMYAITRNPVLATNATALLTYPLAALAMERLLSRLGSSRPAAWLAGLFFALGWNRTPFNLHVLIYPALLLPWIAWAIDGLRERPSPRRALALALALAAGAFASGYASVLAALTALLWAGLELARPIGTRRRFFALFALSALPVGAVALLALRPYLELSQRVRLPSASVAHAATATDWLDGIRGWITIGGWILGHVTIAAASDALANVAIAALAIVLAARAYRRAEPLAQRIAPFGAAFVALGAIASRGYPDWLAPFLAHTPFPLFRYTERYLVLASFGMALLLATALDGRARRGGQRAILVLVAILLIPRLAAFQRVRPWPVAALRDTRAYDDVAAIVDRFGGGPLLELPLRGGSKSTPRDEGELREINGILATTRHWWPTPASYLSYQPDHRRLLLDLLIQLPDPAALDDLVDMTHLRWLLLRPPDSWPDPGRREDFVRRLRGAPAVGRTWPIDGGWLLVQLSRPPGHPQWFAWIASGRSDEGTTVLGTPLAPLPDDGASGELRVRSDALPATVSDGAFWLSLSVRNASAVAWPARPRSTYTFSIVDWLRFMPLPMHDAVALASTWRRQDGAVLAPLVRAPAPQLLRRDVDPGETIQERLLVKLPDEPGDYVLELSLVQIEGTAMRSAGGEWPELPVTVRPDGKAVFARPALGANSDRVESSNR